MFLLIPQGKLEKQLGFSNFKFHYVSINSNALAITLAFITALNYIMFLLIHYGHSVKGSSYPL